MNYGKSVVRRINQNIPFFCLCDEWDPTPVYPEEPKKIEFISYGKAVEEMIAIKKAAQNRPKTIATLQSVCDKFQEFCANNGILLVNIKHVTKEVAQEYIDHLNSQKKSPQTVVNHIAKIKTLFNMMVKRGLIKENPWADIELPKVVQTKKNIAYTEDEINKIKNRALTEIPQLWDIIQVIYYTFLRPIEIGRLKIENILLDQRKIYVPGTASKNKKEAYLAIPEPLVPVLEKRINNPSNWFLFGKDGEPSPKKIGYNWMGRKHSELLKRIGIYDPNKTLYSWKHTGVVAAYKNGVDIKAIQLQCRHYSIEQTDTYLKSLGFVDNDSFRLGVKEI